MPISSYPKDSDAARVLILGATGMLGHMLFLELSRCGALEVYGTVRSMRGLEAQFSSSQRKRILEGVDAFRLETITGAVAGVRPDVILNCIGIIRQLPEGGDPLTCIEINARLPHRLALLAKASGSRLIHVSTDCVFDGKKGNYVEEDHPTAYDVYGISKYLGEVRESPALTIRTSIIGHELRGKLSLVEWFLSQPGTVRGFDRAIYSGLPTCELARVIAEYVLPNPNLSGLYHISSAPISKYELLRLIAECYGHGVDIHRDTTVTVDKSLDSSKFQNATGYSPPDWEQLVDCMYRHHMESKKGK